MTYTIYKSSDAGAPQFPDEKAILKACLVTGYGTGADAKAPAGWEIMFDSDDHAGFKPVDEGGENGILYLNKSGDVWQRRAYNSMTSAGDGVMFHASASASPWSMRSTDKWFIVATKRWFYLFFARENGDTYCYSFFGNIDELLPEKKRRTLFFAPSTYENPSYGASILAYNRNSKASAVSNDIAFACTALNRDQLVYAAADLMWFDIFIATDKDVVGRLPALKACPAPSKLATWTPLSADAYALALTDYGNKYQGVLDLSDVN